VKRLAGGLAVSSRRYSFRLAIRGGVAAAWRQQEWRDGRDDAHPELAMERLSFGAGEFGKFFASRRMRTALSETFSPSAVNRTTRRVRSTRVTPSNVSSSRNPADSVDWVT